MFQNLVWTNTESYDIYDTLMFTPHPRFDAKKLRCKYTHEAYKEQDLIDNPTLNEASCNINVHCEFTYDIPGFFFDVFPGLN